MTAWLLAAAWLMVGTAVATETLLRIRSHWLRDHVAYNLDREDLGVVVVAGLFWPLTLVAGAWVWLYVKREERDRGAA